MIDFLINNWSELVTKTVNILYIYCSFVNSGRCCCTYWYLLSKLKRTSNFVLMIAGVLQTIPTLAVLAIMIPILV